MPLRRKSRKKIPLYLDDGERDGLRKACRFNAQLMDFMRDHVKEGVTTNHLNDLAHTYTLDHGHTPACLGYRGFPKSICTSINEVVCHGIPNNRPLKDGDIVNVDLTTIVDGWFGDQSETFLIGHVSDEARRLVQVTFDSLYVGIDAVSNPCKVEDIGRAIERFVRPYPYSIVQEYQGHGIGREFHQEPGIAHYVPRDFRSPEILQAGMCFTIEPMLNIGTMKTSLDRADGWTVRTCDGELSAQFEHQILLTETGPEILTLTERGPQRGHKF